MLQVIEAMAAITIGTLIGYAVIQVAFFVLTRLTLTDKEDDHAKK